MAQTMENLLNVVPIHKLKSKAQLVNNRPIALLEVTTRVFKKTIARELLNHAQLAGVNPPPQAAFQPGYSTVACMWSMVSDCLNTMNNRDAWNKLQTDINGAFYHLCA